MEAKLSDGQIGLRALEPEDLDFLYRLENDSSLWPYGQQQAPVSRFALKQYIEASLSQDIYEMHQVRLVIERVSDKERLGLIDLFDLDLCDRRAGIGIVVDSPFRRQGFARRALSLLSGYALGFLQLHQVYAHIAQNNRASLELFENEGFVRAGCLRDWHRIGDSYEDVCILQKTAL